MIIFDLDGTLANIEHRRHLVDASLRSKDRDWPEFFRRCVSDTPIEPMCRLFRCLYAGTSELEIWSGRSDEVYWDTVAWLTRHLFEGQSHWTDPEDATMRVKLQMRPAGDTSPDVVLKERMLDAALAEGKVIEFVVDDRQRVVEMWRRRGVFCLQCAEGDY